MENKKNPRLISYVTLRQSVGILGIALPIVLIIGSLALSSCENIRPSISLYYYTVMRNVFVGILCAVGLFLFCYRGYERMDHVLGILGFFFAIGVAFFPTDIDSSQIITGCTQDCSQNEKWVSIVHFTSAALLFLIFAVFSLVLFTRSDQGENRTKRKINRNRLYRICGWIIIVCLLLIAIWFRVDEKLPGLAKYDPVFWLETLALWAFGISWLTKGELIWKDKK